jgi:hypothetical protein
MAPDLVAEFVRAFHEEVNPQQHAVQLAVAQKWRELEEVERKLGGAHRGDCRRFRAFWIQTRLDELERRKATLVSDVAEAPLGTSAYTKPGRDLCPQSRRSSRCFRRSGDASRGRRDLAQPNRADRRAAP